MALVLNSRQFAQYHRKLADRFRPTILRGVRSGAARAIGELVHATRTAPAANPAGIGTGGAVNTGQFVRSWKVIPLPDGAEILNTAPHAPVVDGGRRPGSRFPPRDALIAWIKRKILAPPPKPPRKSKRGSAEDQRAAAEKKRLEAAIRRTGAKDPVLGPRRPTRAKKPPPRRKGVRRTYSRDEQAARLYFPIARAIARRGLIGRKILTSSTMKARILDIVTREVGDQLHREMGKL